MAPTLFTGKLLQKALIETSQNQEMHDKIFRLPVSEAYFASMDAEEADRPYIIRDEKIMFNVEHDYFTQQAKRYIPDTEIVSEEGEEKQTWGQLIKSYEERLDKGEELTDKEMEDYYELMRGKLTSGYKKVEVSGGVDEDGNEITVQFASNFGELMLGLLTRLLVNPNTQPADFVKIVNIFQQTSEVDYREMLLLAIKADRFDLFNPSVCRQRSHGHRKYTQPSVNDVSVDGLLPPLQKLLGVYHIRTKQFSIPLSLLNKL